MRKLDILKQSALVSCKYHKHTMRRFTSIKDTFGGLVTIGATTTCETCGMYVQVLLNPRANEIDIGGTALALDCEDETC